MDKFFLKSKTTWGAILLLAPVVSKICGYDMSAEVIEQINTSLGELLTAIGAVLAIFGIRTADTQLTIKPK